jgi:glycogen debranching enzyme
MHYAKVLIVLISVCLFHCSSNRNLTGEQGQNNLPGNVITIPSLSINGENTHAIAKAYRIAIGDISGNIQYHKSGAIDQKAPCLYAGLQYGKPWTRDAAINVWNGFGLLSPEVAKNTLLAQVEMGTDEKGLIIGQYWDKIIWSIGAWNYYLYSGDEDFLAFAFEVTQNTLQQLEAEEFSDDLGLFRGPAVYGDGVAAYPKIYSNHQDKEKTGSYSGIYQWVEVNGSLKHPVGYGMPMHALSTNIVYYQTYTLLSKMAGELGFKADQKWKDKAYKLHESINKHFWEEAKGNYTYLIDPFGNCDYQESMGIAFSLLFDIADKEKAKKIFETTVVEPAGIPCVYPAFPRFRNEVLDSYGRHSGTVWPHIQGFWADAAMKYDQEEIFLHEFNALTKHANRDFQFVEIYHPTRGTAYGGIQEPHLKEWTEWFCAERQTWSATAYLRMIFRNIVGMDFSEKGIRFKPFLPEGVEEVALLGLKYRDAMLDIHVSGTGNQIGRFLINGVPATDPFIKSNLNKHLKIEIELTQN